MEDKTVIVIGIILVSIVSLVQAAGASYSFDGVPYPDKLELVAHGSLHGGVYVGEARGLGFPPYEQTFELPEEAAIKWARLYVGVWGGTERYEGWVQTTFNGHDLGKTVLKGINDDNPHVYCASHGVYWVHYDVTDKVISGLNTGIAETSRGEKGSKLDGASTASSSSPSMRTKPHRKSPTGFVTAIQVYMVWVGQVPYQQ